MILNKSLKLDDIIKNFYAPVEIPNDAYVKRYHNLAKYLVTVYYLFFKFL